MFPKPNRGFSNVPVAPPPPHFKGSASSQSPSSLYQRLRLFHIKRGVLIPAILGPVRSLKWDRNSWCDATLCVHLRKEKRQSKPDGKVHYFTSLSQCSTTPGPPPRPPSVRRRSSVFRNRKSSREPCRPEDQGSGCETRTPGGHKVMRSS